MKTRDDNTFPCRKGCGKIFKRFKNCERHEKRKNPCKGEQEITQDVPIPKATLVCSKWCQKSFRCKFNLLRHEMTCRKKDNTCFICKKEFKRATHLRRHMEVHTKPTKIRIKNKRKRKMATQDAKSDTDDNVSDADEAEDDNVSDADEA